MDKPTNGRLVEMPTPDESSLVKEIENAFVEAVQNKLGREPKLLQRDSFDEQSISIFQIEDRYSGTKTTIEIPTSLADADENRYLASIDGKEYLRYRSVEDMGLEVTEVFSFHYSRDIMGI
jgi:hypothetical protein